jgi:DNA-binding NtrC family response regulator
MLVNSCLIRLGHRVEGDPLTSAARRLLQEHTWPGNVRELFNVVERALIMTGGRLPFSADDFPQLGGHEGEAVTGEELFKLPPTGIDYEELQRSIVKQALAMTLGNQSSAARLLNVSRARFRTLHGLLGEEDDGE